MQTAPKLDVPPTYMPDPDEDPLAGARGCLLGLVLAAIWWAAGILTLWWVLRAF